MNTQQVKKSVPPYVPYTTFTNFINGLRKTGIPSHIDKSTMHKMSGSGQSAMLAAMKFLKLINENLEPTENLKKIVHGDEADYNTFLAQIIPMSYPFLFDGSIQIEKATSKIVEDKFRHQGASGSTLTKAISFFLAIVKDAKIPISSHVRAPKLERKKSQEKPSKDNHDIDNSQNIHKVERINKHGEMEKITISLPGMEDGYVYFPRDMTEHQAKLAVKMAKFILDNFYGIEDEKMKGEE